MSTKKHLTEQVKSAIVEDSRKGNLYRTIAAKFNVAKSTVASVVQRFQKEGHVVRKPGSGRKKYTTIQEDKLLRRLSVADPRKSAVQLNCEMKEIYGVNVSVSTTKRRLNEAGLFGRRPVKNHSFLRKTGWPDFSLHSGICTGQTSSGQKFFGLMSQCLCYLVMINQSTYADHNITDSTQSTSCQL